MLISNTWLARGVQYAVGEIIKALDSQLVLEHNHSQITLDLTTPNTPGQRFAVYHNLGRVPLRWIANPYSEATVWSADKSLWTDKILYLRCSGSSTLMTLTVL